MEAWMNVGMRERSGMWERVGGGEEGWGSTVGVGTAVAVWGGEVAGVNGGLRTAPSDRKILILSDS